MAAVVFVASHRIEASSGWVGYVRAASEAAMVGAVADWFAVSALFRHPFGLPIPHTAILARRKDALGRGLGEFVRSHFLTEQGVAQRVGDAGIAAHLGRWLDEPANSEIAAAQVANALRRGVEVIGEERLGPELERFVLERAERLDLAPLLGRFVDLVVEGGHTDVVYDSTLRAARAFLAEQRPILRRRLDAESPRWVPEFVDDKVFEKLIDAVDRFLHDVATDPHNELRASIDARLSLLGARMRSEPAFAARAEELKTQILDHDEVRQWTSRLGRGVQAELVAALDDSNSGLRRGLHGGLTDLGRRLRTDAELRAAVDGWFVDVAREVATRAGGEVADLISSTVESWDGAETAARVELHVGRDLQFIRINGTIIGALIGLAIHALGRSL